MRLNPTWKKILVWGPLVVIGGVTLWFQEVIREFLPSPERAKLVLDQTFADTQSPDEERLRFVLCWLEGDPSGRNTELVANAFIGISGIELVRSARIVSATGASDAWRSSMRDQALQVLEDREGDFVVVGFVKESEKSLNLWLISRFGQGTLEKGDKPFVLSNATLQSDFHLEVNSQIVSHVIEAGSASLEHLANIHLYTDERKLLIRKILNLLEGLQIQETDEVAALLDSLGVSLVSLGMQVRDPDYLTAAIESFNSALDLLDAQSYPVEWASIHNTRGLAETHLGVIQSDVPMVERAIRSQSLALEIFKDQVSEPHIALVHNNLGMAYLNLAGLVDRSANLRTSIDYSLKALDMRTPEKDLHEWGCTTLNLGLAMSYLGREEDDEELLRQAINILNSSLGAFSKDRTPLYWAETHETLGDTYLGIARRQYDPNKVRLAEDSYIRALDVYTKDLTFYDWAETHIGLGETYFEIGANEGDLDAFDQATRYFRAVLKDKRTQKARSLTMKANRGLGVALSVWGGRTRNSSRLLQAIEIFDNQFEYYAADTQSVDWAQLHFDSGTASLKLFELTSKEVHLLSSITSFKSSLSVFEEDVHPLDWRNASENYAIALTELGGVEQHTDHYRQAVRLFEGILNSQFVNSSPAEEVRTRLNLGITLGRLGYEIRDLSTLKRSQLLLEEAEPKFVAIGDSLNAQRAMVHNLVVSSMLEDLDVEPIESTK